MARTLIDRGVRVPSRRRGVPAVARTLDQGEALAHFLAYRDEHRRTWVLLRPLLTRLTGRSGQSDEAVFAAIPLVEVGPA